MEYGQGTNN